MNKWGLLTIVMFTSPVEAHCYSHWHYPYPQNCGRGGTGIHNGLKIRQHDAMRVQPPPPAPDKKDWYVEIVLTPKVMEEISDGVGIDAIERNAAVDKLKTQMK